MLNLAKGFAAAGQHVQLVLVRYRYLRGSYTFERRSHRIELRSYFEKYWGSCQIFPLASARRGYFGSAARKHCDHFARLLSNTPRTVIVTEHVHVSIERQKVNQPLIRAAYRAIPCADRQ